MARLTKKYDDGTYGIEKCTCEHEKKLGKLEDIEEELNVDINNDLSKVLLASAKGFYHKEQCENIVTKQKITRYIHDDYAYCYYSKDTNTWFVATINDCFPLYLYGKTWALTKEELE